MLEVKTSKLQFVLLGFLGLFFADESGGFVASGFARISACSVGRRINRFGVFRIGFMVGFARVSEVGENIYAARFDAQ